MLAMLFGFAQIKERDIPAGVMPKDRRQVGTGVITSVDAAPTSTDPTTSDSPPTTTEPITSDTPPTTSDSPSSQEQPSSDPQPTSAAADTSSAGDSSPTSVNGQTDASSDASVVVPTSIAVTTTDADGSTVTSQIATSTLAPASTTTSQPLVSTKSGSSSNLVVIGGSSTIDRSTLHSATVITSALIGKSTVASTYTTYWTSDGSVYSSVVTTDRVVSSTTGYATATVLPGLQNGGNGGGSDLTPQTKAIIGGVVGGIGGAILIGGLAVVAWRLWGKKKRQQDEQDEYPDSPEDSIRREKRATAGPLDRYRNPGGNVNTASNF